jgi:hypothetical protein
MNGEMTNQACSICGNPSLDFHCPRCCRPLCPAHALPARTRCSDCELEYISRRNKRRLSFWFLVPFALTWLCFLPAFRWAYGAGCVGGYRAPTTGHPFSDLLWMVTLISIAVGGSFIGVRLLWLRRRFLGETTSDRE